MAGGMSLLIGVGPLTGPGPVIGVAVRCAGLRWAAVVRRPVTGSATGAVPVGGPAADAAAGDGTTPGGGDAAAVVPAGSVADESGEQLCGRLLVEVLIGVAALRRDDARRAAVEAGAGAQPLQRRPPPFIGHLVAARREAGAARHPVVDDDRAQLGVRVHHHRHPADVPAVAWGEGRQQADRRVLHRMRGTAQPDRREAQTVGHLLRHRPPHRLRHHAVLVQLERILVPHLAGPLVPTQVADHLRDELDVAGAHLRRAEAPTGVLVEDARLRR